MSPLHWFRPWPEARDWLDLALAVATLAALVGLVAWGVL
jgi:hypothetical protein